MNSRARRIRAEAAVLWRELYHEPAPLGIGGGQILKLILMRLPELRYERLSSPFLRPSPELIWPKET